MTEVVKIGYLSAQGRIRTLAEGSGYSLIGGSRQLDHCFKNESYYHIIDGSELNG